MKDKELRKLSRKDLLTLLVEITEESEALSSELGETKKRETVLFDDNEQFKKKIAEQENLIQRLKIKLDEKDAMIETLQTEIMRLSLPTEEHKKMTEKEMIREALQNGTVLDDTLQAILDYAKAVEKKNWGAVE